MTEVATGSSGTPGSPDVDFDVAVVGAGVAGAVTALLLARRGRSVVLIERGHAAGAKNLSGGVLYPHTLAQVFPDWAQRAPIERVITRHHTAALTRQARVGLDYADARLASPANAVTVLRGPFDAWLADQAEDAGAFLMTEVRVDHALTEPATPGPQAPDGRRVVGVRAGDDELRAHVVVAADGVNSYLARDAGWRPAPPLRHLALGVKALVRLPRDVVETRFGVSGQEGAAWALVGDATAGLPGGGFLYTNRESVSAGIVVRLDALAASGRRATDVFDHFLAHPHIAPLLADGELAEYGAHLVPEGGLGMVGRLATHGMLVVGDAAGLCLNTGLTVRGMDLAIGSSIAAADAIDAALAVGDVSASGLAGYRGQLFSGVVGADMRTYARAPGFLETPRLYHEYGQFVSDALYDVYRHDGRPRRRLWRTALRRARGGGLRARELAHDALEGVRSL